MNQNLEDRERYDYLFKIILAGDTSVGKTNLVQAFNRLTQKSKQKLNDRTPPLNTNIAPTIGVEFSTRIVELESNKKKIKTQIWDTAGQEQYRSITTAHYRKALGALVVYDITKIKTFQNVKRWIQSIREQADPNIVIVLVGNKIDQKGKEQVSSADARKLAINEGISFSQTSALTYHNVKQTFMDLIQQIYKRMVEKEALNQGQGKQGQGHKLTSHNNHNNQGEKCEC